MLLRWLGRWSARGSALECNKYAICINLSFKHRRLLTAGDGKGYTISKHGSDSQCWPDGAMNMAQGVRGADSLDHMLPHLTTKEVRLHFSQTKGLYDITANLGRRLFARRSGPHGRLLDADCWVEQSRTCILSLVGLSWVRREDSMSELERHHSNS